ncbi:hypothetical protein [Streptomyces sp. NPDC020681]|uniref:hypothetical protein n=1 Tax=Streptomyces sp. NPDC020681 TaxID=3365083 RepID=UPI0037A51A0D
MEDEQLVRHQSPNTTLHAPYGDELAASAALHPPGTQVTVHTAVLGEVLLDLGDAQQHVREQVGIELLYSLGLLARPLPSIAAPLP